MPLIEEVWRADKRGLRYNLHPGQQRAWNSTRRIVAIISGVRSGKTSFGPLWLHREMLRCGPGDYLAVAPTFPLLDNGIRPEVEAFFGRLLRAGTGTQRQFLISEEGHGRLWPGVSFERPSRIIYGHAQNPDSLAALRARAAWLDEAGQKDFRLASYEEVQRRVSFDLGRILISTTVYNLGWLKQQVYDRWEQAKRDHAEIDVINFRSIDNPAFPAEEYHRAFRELPTWKARMFFDGVFTRPAGLIYDSFDPMRHVCPRYALPDDWMRYAGLDFGAVNTAAVYLAEERNRQSKVPTGRYVVYREYPDREYLPGKHAPSAHGVRLLRGEPMTPLFVGGSASEDDWRGQFRDAGVPVLEPPISGVENQINALYQLIAENRLIVMDDCVGVLDQLASYSRELDESGEPTEKIDNDSSYHYCFVAGTPVMTPAGEVPIETLRIGDLVLTRRGYRRVVANMKRGPVAVRRLALSDGRELIGTPDHPVWVRGKGFVAIDRLEEGDTLVECEQKQSSSTASSTPAIPRRRATHSGTTTATTIPSRDSLSSIAKSGRRLTEKFQKGCASTTVTATRRTTQSRTSNCSPPSIIPAITACCRAAYALRGSVNISTRSGRSPLIACVVRRVGLSAAHQSWSDFLESLSLSLCVVSAAPSATSRLSASSALTSAPPNAEGSRASITRSGFAPSAPPSSPSTGGRRRRIAPVRVSTVRAIGAAEVFNLTVEGPHEYFANGILVSNCAALRYIASFLARAGLAGFQATRDQSSPLADAPPGVFHDLPDERPGRIGGGSYTASFPEF